MESLFRREPRFDGVFGFSQGAALTSLLVGLRAPNGQVSPDKPVSFDFAVMVGGFRSDSADHAHLYAARDSYTLPSLHIIGRADRIVPAQDSRILAAQFTSPTVLEHAGGHIIPGGPHVRHGFTDFLNKRR
jgi:predicted esterase